MLLKIFWIIDIFLLVLLLISAFKGRLEIGAFTYVILYFILIGVSFFIQKTHPKIAIFLASVPVLVPILAILFFVIGFRATGK